MTLAELVKKLNSKHPMAINDLVKNFGHKMLQMAIKRGAKPDEAEDIVQDSTLALWKNHSNIQPEQFYGLLYTIIKHKTIDYIRKNRKEVPTHPSRLKYISEKVDRVLPHDFISLEKLRILQGGLSTLSDARREALELYFTPLSRKEIAESLRISPDTYKTRLFHARQELRQHLQKIYRDY